MATLPKIDWDLYDGMNGVKQASRRMTSAYRSHLKKRLTEFAQDKIPTLQDVAEAVQDDMNPIMLELSDFGAQDSEPAYVLRQLLRKKLNAKL